MDTKEYLAGHDAGHADAISEMRRTILQQLRTPSTAYTLGGLNEGQLSTVLQFVNSFTKS